MPLPIKRERSVYAITIITLLDMYIGGINICTCCLLEMATVGSLTKQRLRLKAKAFSPGLADCINRLPWIGSSFQGNLEYFDAHVGFGMSLSSKMGHDPKSKGLRFGDDGGRKVLSLTFGMCSLDFALVFQTDIIQSTILLNGLLLLPLRSMFRAHLSLTADISSG